MAVATASVLFVSCDNDSGIEQPDVVVPANASATALTVSLSAKINGVSNTDMAFGKGGVLFCKKNDNAESIFKSWKDGVEEPEGCQVFQGGRVAGGEFNGTIKNLYPDTEYNYCIFFKNKDNSMREISDVMTFRTAALVPEYHSFSVGGIRMFSALVEGVQKINATDFNNCTWGIMVSDSENGKLEDSKSVSFGESDQNIALNFNVRYLSPGTDYWYCTYIKYSTYDNLEHVQYGARTKFTTRDDKDWGVDMGLPSGLLWARCNLGIEDFENAYENIFYDPFYCYWGSMKNPITDDDEAYEYWDAKTHSYINIGNNIEGTKYDIAHVMMGGKWRLPTKADVQELITYCKVGSLQEKVYYYSTEDYSIRYYTSCVPVTGPNGKGFSTNGSGIWTGTMSEDGVHPYCAYCGYNAVNDSAFFVLCDTLPRDVYLTVRPVWDPNME